MPHDACDSGNSEKQLIGLLRNVLHDFLGSVNRTLQLLGERLGHHETKTEERHLKLMTALETLTASVDAMTTANTALTSAVNDAITRIGTPNVTDAQLISIAGVVDHNTEVVKAQTEALRAALAAAPVPNPTP